jgi:hypothetical protein
MSTTFKINYPLIYRLSDKFMVIIFTHVENMFRKTNLQL